MSSSQVSMIFNFCEVIPVLLLISQNYFPTRYIIKLLLAKKRLAQALILSSQDFFVLLVCHPLGSNIAIADSNELELIKLIVRMIYSATAVINIPYSLITRTTSNGSKIIYQLITFFWFGSICLLFLLFLKLFPSLFHLPLLFTIQIILLKFLDLIDVIYYEFALRLMGC